MTPSRASWCSRPWFAWAMHTVAIVACSSAFGEGYGGLSGLGPVPTGLATTAFSALEPVRMPTSPMRPDLAARPARSLPVTLRPLSPAERAGLVDADADLFPLTRRAVPLLVPDAGDVTSQPVAPARAMSGPSVGVPWRIPGYAP